MRDRPLADGQCQNNGAGNDETQSGRHSVGIPRFEMWRGWPAGRRDQHDRWRKVKTVMGVRFVLKAEFFQ